MVDLGFGGSIGLGFNGGDVRSVIKNATKDVNMSESKNKTILNSEDIKRKKVEDKRKEIKSKVVPGAKVENQPVKLQSSINDSGNEKINKINMGNNNIGGNFGVNIGGLNGIGDINNIKVGNVKGVDSVNNNVENNNDRFINSRGRITGLKDVVDVDSVIEDLYLDVGEGLKNGTLANADIGQIKNLYNELGALDDNVVMDMIGDLATLYKKGLPLNSENLNKFKEYYPELKNVGYGFTSGGEYNMYQGGGFKEAMNEGSPTDLNKYGVGGKVAETVVNPLGEATTALDNLAQQIPQVDGHKLEDKLKKRLSSLTDEDIDRYYRRYKELTDQGKLKMYTTKVKGNTLVGQMWSAIFGNEKNGRKYQDVEGGFKQWMIDQVNNEVNGFIGDLMDAQYFDQNVGPNVGKMMMNIPGSAVKTTTAIARAITNPLDTVSGLWVLGKDAVEHVRDGNFKDSILGQRYGSWEALAKAMEQDPVGVASDILAVAEGGASLGKGALKIGKGGMKGASFTTYVLGAERTSEGLLKIANRLEKLEGRISEFGKTAGGASDIGMRQLFYGVEKDGKMVGGLINGLEKRAGEGDNLVNKAAGYIAKTQQPMKVVSDEYKKIKEAGGVMDRLAQKITGKSDAESKLFQAASPSINRLTKGIDYKNKKANMDLATRTIVEGGYKPRTIEEWAKAHLETLNKKWKEFTDIVKKNGDATVKTDKLIEVLENHLKETGRNITANQRGDIRAIQQEIKNLKDRGEMTMMDLEDFKESINSETKNKTQTQKGDIYIRGLKKLSQAIGEIQNDILSKAPDEVKGLKKQIGALLDTKDDVIKANVKNLKRKEGGGLIENYSRIAGVGDVIKGAVKAVLPGEQGGLAELGKGVGKVVLGKALGRAKDVDFLVKEGFKGLEKKIKNEGKGMEMKGKVDEDKGVRYKKDSDNRLKDEKDYEDSQNLAYRKGKSTDKEIKINNDSKVVKDIKKKAKNVGFITKIVNDINKKLGLNDKEKVRGYADLNEKTINLSKNPTDTTAQHEYFHAVFSVVDNKTKKYILGEAKKFLKEKLVREVGDIAAEEWLAESFGVYIRDKEIKLGVLDGVKGFDKVKNMVRDLFQRGYEWMQNYNMDRFGVNRLFNEIWGGNLKVDEKGALDLSYLFGEDKLGGNADMGLNKKNGLRYKKAGNLEKNDYTTNGLKKMETSVLAPNGKSNGLSEKVSTKPSTNFFELKDGKKNYILVDFADGKGKQKVYGAGGGRNQFTKRRLQLSNKNLDYRKNLDRLNSWLSDGDVGMSKSVLVGRTGKGKSIRLSKQGLYHIYEKHGAIDFDTLIEAINDPTRQKQETVGDKRFRYEIDLGGNDDRVLLLGLNGHTFKKGDLIIEKDANKVQSYSIAGASERESSKVPSKDVRLKRDSTGKELSKGQQEYFKDSKIRDAEGNLLRVYHGTHNDFTVFDRNKIGTNTNNKGIFGEGFYATSKESFANMYAGKGYSKEGLEGKVMEGYVDIKNPFMRNDYKGEVALEKLRKGLGLGKNVIKLNKLDNMIHPLIEPKQSEKFRAALEKAGYDGVVFKYPEGGGDEIVAFNSNQFKNIDNLNPTKNPDIRYKKDNTGKELSQAQQEFFKDSKVRDANGKLLRMYHGSKAKFTVFDTKKIGEHGTSKGRGFYFTPNKGMGEGYGDVMEVYLDIKKPLNYEGRDISKAQLKELINRIYNEQMTKEGSEGIGILDDFGDISYEGKDKVLREAVDIIDSNTNDVDLMNELIGISGDYDTVAKVITDYLGYDGVIKDGEYVIFNSNQAKNINNLNPTKNPDIRYKKGWHGSPAEFDRFDSTHIGEGEGAQAHGWGHYIAVDEKTGRYYADTLNGPKYKGKEKYQLADLPGYEYNVLTPILDKVADGVEPGKAIEDTKKWYNELINDKKEILKTETNLDEIEWAEKEINRYNEMLKVLDGLKEDDFKSSKGNRNLYEVEIPDPVKRDTPTGSNYIEEDSKIGDKAFKKMIKWFEDDGWKVEEHYGNYDVEKGGVAFNLTNGDNTWRELIRDEIEDQKAFSEVLDRMGYDGIHYYGGRDGESYVIFNDKKATITNHLRFKKGLNKKLGSLGVMNSKGNIGGLSRKGLGTMAKGLRYKQQQDLKN